MMGRLLMMIEFEMLFIDDFKCLHLNLILSFSISRSIPPDFTTPTIQSMSSRHALLVIVKQVFGIDAIVQDSLSQRQWFSQRGACTQASHVRSQPRRRPLFLAEISVARCMMSKQPPRAASLVGSFNEPLTPRRHAHR